MFTCLNVRGQGLNVLRDAVVLFHILLGTALRAVGPGLAPQGLQ